MPLGTVAAGGALSSAAGSQALAGATKIRHSKFGRSSGGGGRSPKRKKRIYALIAIIVALALVIGGYLAIIRGILGAMDDEENGGYYETRLYVRTTDANNPDVIPLTQVPTGDASSTNSGMDSGSATAGQGTAAVSPATTGLMSLLPGFITAHAADKDKSTTDVTKKSDTNVNSPSGTGNDPTKGAISGITVNLTGADDKKNTKNDSAADQAKKQEEAAKKQDTKKDSKKKGSSSDGSDSDSSGGDLSIGPTDNNGIAYTVLSGAANGAFTYACDPQFAPDATGRPTKYEVKWNSGATEYDSYSYIDVSDTGTCYYLNKAGHDTKNTSDAGFAKGGKLSSLRNSASDTWHVVGVQSNRAANRVPYFSYIYVYNNDHPEASYGAAVCLDNGTGLDGNGALVDQFMPSNKYYGKYGYNVSPGAGYGEHKVGKGGAMGYYFEAFGIPAQYAVTMENCTIYVLSGYNQQSGGGKASKGTYGYQKYVAPIIAGQNWPGVSGNPVAQNSGGATQALSGENSSTPTTGSSGTGMYDVTYTGEEESASKGDTQVAPYSAGSKESPLTMVIPSKKETQVRLEFWVERVYIGPGGSASASTGLGDYSDWQNTKFPQFYCYSPKGQNPYKTQTTPGRGNDNSQCNALPNCTAYAWGLSARKGHVLPHWGNADTWAKSAMAAGYSVDRASNPRVGDVFCMAPKMHVGVVIGVDQKNNKVITAESDFSNKDSKNPNFCVMRTHQISRIPYYIHMK